MRVNDLRPESARASARPPRSLPIRVVLLTLGLSLTLSCSGSGDYADTGGMSGTGISQGSISAFGSIFVNGVEWSLTDATITADGAPATESDLRRGMVVRIEGRFESNGTTGTATSVVFDDSVEGPIEGDPVDDGPGRRRFDVLGTSVIIQETITTFDGGASFAGLVADDVVEVSGFVDANGAILASRVELKGDFPNQTDVELRGMVTGLLKGPGESGSFLLGSILVRYTAATRFSDVTRGALADGNRVEVEGRLNLAANEIDADGIELERRGLGDGDADEVELEGILASCVTSADFCVDGTPVDASNATLEPPGFPLVDGARIEVKGRLENGVLIATRIESEDDEEAQRNVRIEAAVSSVDAAARQLTILGVTVFADGKTELEDERANHDENFRFDEIQPGDWLDIKGFWTTESTVRADSIERDDDGVDVRLEGPVTSLDANTPALAILGRAIPLDAGTAYFDAMGLARTEADFFLLSPGNVALGDVVRARDRSALDLEVLGESDEVEIEGEND